MRCEGRLIHNTGICPGNYKYFSSKGDADGFFLGKAKSSFDNYSVIRPDPTSKNGFNVACVHVNKKYDETTECDYVSFRYDEYSRWFHCQVVDREYVNENSCRLYFVIDYVATFFDTIKLGKCLVERSHVDDDWISQEAHLSAHKYLIPEPVAANSYHRPELLLINPYEVMNQKLNIDNGLYNMITSVSKDGKINEPKIKYQAGGNISGYLERGTRPQIEEAMGLYVTYMNKLINKRNSMIEYVQSIYFAPDEVTNDDSGAVIIYPSFFNITTMIRWGNLPNIKHAKTLMYFSYLTRSNGNDYTFKAHEYGDTVVYDFVMSGGPSGYACIRYHDKTGIPNSNIVRSLSWPNLSPSATVNSSTFEFNIEAFRSAYASVGISYENFNG